MKTHSVKKLKLTEKKISNRNKNKNELKNYNNSGTDTFFVHYDCIRPNSRNMKSSSPVLLQSFDPAP